MALNKYISSAMLVEILTRAEPEERNALYKVLHDGSPKAPEPRELQEEVCAAAGNSVANFIRSGRGISYAELLFDAAGHLKVEGVKSVYSAHHRSLCLDELDRLNCDKAEQVNPDERMSMVDKYVDDIERKILSKVMVVAYERATPAQRASVDAKLAELAKTPEGKNISGLSTTAALLVVGNLGGFATYTFMSTVLSALSLGSLGFGAYTLASSLLSVVLGPVGWLSLAAYGIFKLGSADEAKMVRLAATCAMTAQRIREKRTRRR
jgi:uncharacterized protein YaaW (UPF0174 family)